MPSVVAILMMASLPFAASLVAAPIVPQQAPWRLREVAAAQCLGGDFRQAAISADSSRLLTIGELGDAILWDLPNARELQRFAAVGGDVVACHLHPCDPWAIVVVGWHERIAHRLDFGSGRYQRLWTEPVLAFAFDPSGTRAAVLFGTDQGSQLAIYPEALLRSAKARPPDFSRSLRSWREVLFHPHDAAVFVGDWRESWRIPLDGGEPTRAPDGLCGFLPDGTEVLGTRDEPCADCAGLHTVSRSRGRVVRRGAAPAEWSLEHPSWSGDPHVAPDGTVAAADDRGGLHLFGPAPERRALLRGHPGPVLGLCFDSANRSLAMTGAGMLSVLDLQSGTCQRRAGTFTVAPAGNGGFLVLEPTALHRLDPGTFTMVATTSVPDAFAAETFRRYWTGEAQSLPFLWQPAERRLWLDRPACLVDGRHGTLLDQTRRADECPYQDVIAIAAGGRGDVLFAETTRPIQCGNGLEAMKCWSSIRRYDQQGHLRRSRAFAHRLPWMRASPRGERLAIPEPEGCVAVLASHDLHTIGATGITPGADVVAFEFVAEDEALATDGTQLLHVHLTSGRIRRIALPALPGPITRIAVSMDRTLVALACHAEVRVLARP